MIKASPGEQAGAMTCKVRLHKQQTSRDVCVVQTLMDHSISNQIRVHETRIIIQLTFLYSFCDFPCILGEIQVCHVGLEVANRTLPSCHAESLYGQICQESKQREF